MFHRNHPSPQAFTLIELLIVIFILGIIVTSVRYVNFNEINNRKNAEVFTNNISRVFENTRNNALLWRSFLDQNPAAWRVHVNLTNSGTLTTEYLSGTTWELYNESDYSFQVDFPSFINSITCDINGDVSSGTGTLVFTGRDLSFSGACNSNDKIMRIGTNYSSFTGEVKINSVSWVIETRD